MVSSSGNSFVVLRNLNDTILEGSIVEAVSSSTNPDVNIVLGIGLNQRKFVNESGVVFSVTGTNQKIASCFERVQEPTIPTQMTRTKVIREQGEPGERGSRGPVGPQGSVGPQGPQGELGAQGPQGDIGPAGVSGHDGVGVKKVESLDQSNILIHLTDDTVFSAGLPKGPPGFNGMPGERGETGEQGEKGDRGPVGPEGSVGVVGPKGEKGPKGDKGSSGKDGVDGKDGGDGAQGERGPRGEKGTKGPKGDSGKQGIPGTVGSIGPKGPQGEEGKRGPKGEIGKRGTEGKSGVVRARFPLKYDEKKQELTFDAKSLERVLNVNNFDPMAVNNLMTAIGGGGAVGIRHDGRMIIKSVSDINVTRGLEILPKGKNVELQLDTDVSFAFVGTTLSGQKNEDQLGTGDFWFNSTIGKLFLRIDESWVEV